jgi:hypothetical protein
MTQRQVLHWSYRSRTIASIVGLCSIVSGPLMAAGGDAVPIEGRWQTAGKDLVLDMSRCAQGYCGQLVTDDSRCDRTIMTVVARPTTPRSVEAVFDGDLAPPKALRRSYKVRVGVWPATEQRPVSMVIIGDEVDPNPVRRTFPYRAVLTRVGEAACQARTTS